MNHPRTLLLSAGALGAALLLGACKPPVDPEPPEPRKSRVFVQDLNAAESNVPQTIAFTITLDTVSALPVTMKYYFHEITAQFGADFEGAAGTLTFAPGETSKTLEAVLAGDTLREQGPVQEQFELVCYDLENGVPSKLTGLCRITDDDSALPLAPDGYVTPASYPGYRLVWSDEFEGSELDPAVYTFETGNNNGWGNEELQTYTINNERLENGKLILEARNDAVGPFSPPAYTSARIITRDKKAFRYGRIDIRAKVPVTQGLWPAIWMLGSNFGAVGWPACGEIDIMELIGREPSTVHGTAHYFSQLLPNNRSRGSKYLLPAGQTFDDAYHVFSLLWTNGRISWFVDDQCYFTLADTDLVNANSPFNQEFFFIFNIAVGGRWPGNPDATTVLPQQMAIDYVRVFQIQ